MSKQFSTVSSRYGAPMGRHAVPDLDTSPHSVRLFGVRLDSGGYDDGGAYWGYGGHGALYCARDKNGDEQFTRATSREHAALMLDIPAPSLRVPFDWRERCRMWRDAGHLDAADVDAYAEACEMVEREAAGTRVVFRVWHRDTGAVIALFPDVDESVGGVEFCGSYEHVGQHGSANYAGVIGATRPATPDEYAPLKRELESAPYFYNLKVRSRK